MALVLIKYGVGHPIARTMIECSNEGDCVVLIQDGVFWAITGELEGTKAEVFALQEDVCARGYQPDAAGVSVISYPELVDIIVREEKIIS